MSALVYATAHLGPDTAVAVVGKPFAIADGQRLHAVRVGNLGNDLRIVGAAADLERLADALREAAANLKGEK